MKNEQKRTEQREKNEVYTSDNISDEKQGARLGYEHSGSEGGSETESTYLESI
jgi:hypothetical protein